MEVDAGRFIIDPVNKLYLRLSQPHQDRRNELRLLASKDSIYLRNHLHRCVFDRSFITA
jgi:hypothetical protein